LYFVEEYSPPDVGEYPDAFTVWGLVAPTPGSGQQDAARFVSSKKAGRTPKESDLLASLKDDSPPLLFGSSTAPGCVTLVPKTKGFGANLPNFKDYDETSESQRTIITKWLDEWHIGATSNLDYNDPVQRLSQAMCDLGLQLNKEFLDAVTNLYRKFHVVCRYSAPQAWLLVGCASRILWIHIKSIRARAMGIDDISTPRARATIIWTMMQSLMALKEILDVGMECHPDIMKEIMRFQLEHRVDESQIKAVENLVEGIRKEVKECNAATVKCEKAMAALTEKVSKNSQEIGNLKNQVKTKGKKETP
jgi:hypothetical protein